MYIGKYTTHGASRDSSDRSSRGCRIRIARWCYKTWQLIGRWSAEKWGKNQEKSYFSGRKNRVGDSSGNCWESWYVMIHNPMVSLSISKLDGSPMVSLRMTFDGGSLVGILSRMCVWDHRPRFKDNHHPTPPGQSRTHRMIGLKVWMMFFFAAFEIKSQKRSF